MIPTNFWGQETAGSDTPFSGYEVTSEGAWCWFADPRALHYENEEGTINKTYIGYIDVHGNIKAMQMDHRTQKQEEVLIRSWFQPDDHNNPTFLVLPDERVMVFYSRHTDEPCFYYRVSQKPGDITTLGEEKVLKTKNNTTYPSPFILADDPQHIYLCWRGIAWHPTIGRLTLPDANGDTDFDWGPFQMVQSTGARPYAKYASNGKDKIYLAYTTGHPDNEQPNFVYFNYVDIKNKQLKDIKGKKLSTIEEGPYRVNKQPEYVKENPHAVVCSTNFRNWLWEVVADKKGNPVIAQTRISEDKNEHEYYHVTWSGGKWKSTFLAKGGGHFHQTPGLEKCYSGGMAIDKLQPNRIVCSVPVEGAHGKVYELVSYTVGKNGKVTAEQVTRDSKKNNARPYFIPGVKKSSDGLAWMHGDYHDWIVSNRHPFGYGTAIHSQFPLLPREDFAHLPKADRTLEFDPQKEFVLTTTVSPDVADYQGCLLHLGALCYYLDGKSMKPEIRYNGKAYRSTNLLGTADTWKQMQRSTNGRWYAPQKMNRFTLTLVYEKGVLSTYINGLLDQKVTLDASAVQ